MAKIIKEVENKGVENAEAFLEIEKKKRDDNIE